MLRGKTDPTLFQFHAGTSYRPDYFVGSKQGGFNIDQLSMMNIRFQLQTCANLSHMQINLSRVQTCEIGLHARNIKRTYFGISTSAEMLSASRSNVVPWSLISLVTLCRSGLAEYMGSLAGHSQQLASQSFDHRLVHILSKKGRPQNFFFISSNKTFGVFGDSKDLEAKLLWGSCMQFSLADQLVCNGLWLES